MKRILINFIALLLLFQCVLAEDALSAALADSANVGSLIGNSEEYMLQDDNMTDPITRYGSRGVITGITPYLFTIAKDEWMPMWHIECASEYADGFRLP